MRVRSRGGGFKMITQITLSGCEDERGVLLGLALPAVDVCPCVYYDLKQAESYSIYLDHNFTPPPTYIEYYLISFLETKSCFFLLFLCNIRQLIQSINNEFEMRSLFLI